MALIDLLTNPEAFKIGIRHGTDEEGNPIISPNTNIIYGSPKGSKKIKNKVTSTNGLEREVPDFHLVDRVRWSYSDQNADPIYLDAGEKSHFQNGGLPDFIFRGGFETNKDRRRIDVKRISKLIYSSRLGRHFILRQGALQLLNPQENTRTFNAGVSLIAQVAAADTVKFKRSGAIPEPVGTEKGVNETLGELLGAGNFLTNVLGGDYLDIKKEEARSDTVNKYNLGDPAKKAAPDLGTVGGWADMIVGDLNPFKKKESYDVKVPISKKDKLNAQVVFLKGPDIDSSAGENNLNDFVKFNFEVIDSNEPLYSKVIAFRAFLTNFSDNFNATHNNIKFNGRGETFYTYNKFHRKIVISFKIAPQTRDEMKPIYQKLNYLAAQTAPNYSAKGRIRTPYMKLTMGDYLNRVPGILNNVSVSWNKEYPWEIALGKSTQTTFERGEEIDDPLVRNVKTVGKKDKDMKVLPHILDISIGFTPIHDFVPDNQINTPFIGLGLEESGDNSWLPKNENPASKILDGKVHGCTDGSAINYNVDAQIDDNSCKYTETVGEAKSNPGGDILNPFD